MALLAGCQAVTGLSELEADVAAEPKAAGTAAPAMKVASARSDAGMPARREAPMADPARDDMRESPGDGGMRTAAHSVDAGADVGRVSADAGHEVAGQGGSAGSAIAVAGSSGSNGAGAGAGGQGVDAGAPLEEGSNQVLGNTDIRVSDILGYYSGTWGQMILRKQGDEIIGVYEYREGTLIGEINVEGVFVGWWTQAPTRMGLDAGELEFRWSKAADGAAIALDGRWRYGADGEWLENWDVMRVTDRSAPSQLSDRFESTDDFKRRP